MATEWYLMSDTYGANDSHDMEIDEAFNSAAGEDVEVYIYDLSEHFSTRCIVENRTQDTPLNAFIRYFLFPVGTVKAGLYVKYKNRYWIINAIVDDNGYYQKAVSRLCTAKIEWVDQNGVPHRRYCSTLNATQYNNGETSARYYDFRTDQLVLTVPDDPISLRLENGKRFVIDKRTRLYENDISEGTLKRTDFDLITYQITRSDNTLYDYGDSGVLQMMVTQDEQHEEDGYYLINNEGYWICEEPPETIPAVNAEDISISFEENIVYISAGQTLFTANVPDGVEFEWEYTEAETLGLDVLKFGNTIAFETDNAKLKGSSFILKLSADGYNPYEIAVSIKNFF